jgi:hypothetical protein
MFRDTTDEPQTYEEMIERYRASAKRLKLHEPNKPAKGVVSTLPPPPPLPPKEGPRNALDLICERASPNNIALAAERMEADLQKPVPALPERVRAIVDMVAQEHGIDVRWLLGSTRVKAVVKARHELYWHLYRAGAGEWSTPKIGEWCGGKDHTSVLFGIKAVTRYLGEPYALHKDEPPADEVA